MRVMFFILHRLVVNGSLLLLIIIESNIRNQVIFLKRSMVILKGRSHRRLNSLVLRRIIFVLVMRRDWVLIVVMNLNRNTVRLLRISLRIVRFCLSVSMVSSEKIIFLGLNMLKNILVVRSVSKMVNQLWLVRNKLNLNLHNVVLREG